MKVRPEVGRLGDQVAAQLHRILSNDLIGVYFVGSVALGGYIPNQSDIDILAVASGPVPNALKTQIADSLLAPGIHCPARGLEFNLYRRQVAERTPTRADFEVSVNGGPAMDRKVVLDPASEPSFWYLLDRAVANRFGITVVGPPAAEVIADIGRSALLEAMAQSTQWHRLHERMTFYTVLNAARAWRFAAENVLGTKLDGAAWARGGWPDPTLLDAAVQLRRGRRAQLDPAEADNFLAHVGATLLSCT